MASVTEDQVANALTLVGFSVLRAGWPDYLAVHTATGEAVAVEVKAGNDAPNVAQKAMHQALARAGLPVLVAHKGYSQKPAYGRGSFYSWLTDQLLEDGNCGDFAREYLFADECPKGSSDLRDWASFVGAERIARQQLLTVWGIWWNARPLRGVTLETGA